MSDLRVPFNKPGYPRSAISNVERVLGGGHTAGAGPFGAQAERVLADLHQGARCFLTTSGTHALEMSARLLNLRPGDEVIVPDFTFVSTASAFFWNGALPVLADVVPQTLTLDPASVERMIGPRTRAICPVHYAGVAADLDSLQALARDNGLTLVEDNAHGLGGSFGGEPLGTFGEMSILSFHETKNVSCGEGGALIVNDAALADRAEILREKGTNRQQFMEGRVDKYTWVDVGSSWVQSEILASILVAQLERMDETNKRRQQIWATYRRELNSWAAGLGAALPTVPDRSKHPGHLFYIMMPDEAIRQRFIRHMREAGVLTVFHYQALSSSAVCQEYNLRADDTPVSQSAAARLVRLPLYDAMSQADVELVVDAARAFSGGVN